MSRRCALLFRLGLAAWASLAFLGCEDHAGGPLPAAPAPSADDFDKSRERPAEAIETPDLEPLTAREVFDTRCAQCHGQDGRGNGPAAAALTPKPRDYTNKAWQQSVSDAHIKKTIVKGGAAVGKSPQMAPNPDLADNPQVLDGLVRIVRSFGASNG